MKSSRDRVLYLELSANSHEVGAFMLQTSCSQKWLLDRLPQPQLQQVLYCIRLV
jgi:hypothetical protein